jgi:excisionase family DNA binding protein
MDIKNIPKLLKKKDVAAILGCTVRTVDKLRKTRELREVNIGGLIRFDPQDLQDLINRRKTRRPPLMLK